MGNRRPVRPVWLLALLMGGVSAPALACATDEGCIVDSVREQFLKRDKALAGQAGENSCTDCDDIDFEESGCIEGYGLDMSSFSLSGLADGLMDSLKDAVCSAADNYVAGQVEGIGGQIEAPMGVGGIDVGLEKGGSGVDFDHGNTELDFDFDSMVNEQANRLPRVGTGYYDGDYTGGSTLDDIDHVNEGRRR